MGQPEYDPARDVVTRRRCGLLDALLYGVRLDAITNMDGHRARHAEVADRRVDAHLKVEPWPGRSSA